MYYTSNNYQLKGALWESLFLCTTNTYSEENSLHKAVKKQNKNRNIHRKFWNNYQCFLSGQIYKYTLAKGAKYSEGTTRPSYHSPDKNILSHYLSMRQAPIYIGPM